MKKLVYISIIMLIVAFFEMPYGYYELLRFVISITAGIITYSVFNKIQTVSFTVILWGFLVLLYNPVIKIHLDREIWQVINIITICLMSVYLWKINKKAKINT
jgi:hypothetical protein